MLGREDCYLPFKNNLEPPQQKRDTSFQSSHSTWDLFRFPPWQIMSNVWQMTLTLGCGVVGRKEGRMKEEEGEGSHIDKSKPEKLVHTVWGLVGGWTRTGLIPLLDKEPGRFNTDRLSQHSHSWEWCLSNDARATWAVGTMAEEVDKDIQRNYCRKPVDSHPCARTSTFPLIILVSGFVELKKCPMINWQG